MVGVWAAKTRTVDPSVQAWPVRMVGLPHNIVDSGSGTSSTQLRALSVSVLTSTGLDHITFPLLTSLPRHWLPGVPSTAGFKVCVCVGVCVMGYDPAS